MGNCLTRLEQGEDPAACRQGGSSRREQTQQYTGKAADNYCGQTHNPAGVSRSSYGSPSELLLASGCTTVAETDSTATATNSSSTACGPAASKLAHLTRSTSCRSVQVDCLLSSISSDVNQHTERTGRVSTASGASDSDARSPQLSASQSRLSCREGSHTSQRERASYDTHVHAFSNIGAHRIQSWTDSTGSMSRAQLLSLTDPAGAPARASHTVTRAMSSTTCAEPMAVLMEEESSSSCNVQPPQQQSCDMDVWVRPAAGVPNSTCASSSTLPLSQGMPASGRSFADRASGGSQSRCAVDAHGMRLTSSLSGRMSRPLLVTVADDADDLSGLAGELTATTAPRFNGSIACKPLKLDHSAWQEDAPKKPYMVTPIMGGSQHAAAMDGRASPKWPAAQSGSIRQLDDSDSGPPTFGRQPSAQLQANQYQGQLKLGSPSTPGVRFGEPVSGSMCGVQHSTPSEALLRDHVWPQSTHGQTGQQHAHAPAPQHYLLEADSTELSLLAHALAGQPTSPLPPLPRPAGSRTRSARASWHMGVTPLPVLHCSCEAKPSARDRLQLELQGGLTCPSSPRNMRTLSQRSMQAPGQLYMSQISPAASPRAGHAAARLMQQQFFGASAGALSQPVSRCNSPQPAIMHAATSQLARGQSGKLQPRSSATHMPQSGSTTPRLAAIMKYVTTQRASNHIPASPSSPPGSVRSSNSHGLQRSPSAHTMHTPLTHRQSLQLLRQEPASAGEALHSLHSAVGQRFSVAASGHSANLLNNSFSQGQLSGAWGAGMSGRGPTSQPHTSQTPQSELLLAAAQ